MSDDKELQDIISDAEIDRVHGSANFGGMSKRAVVDDTVLKCAFGFRTGHTAHTIAHKHRLISATFAAKLKLTKKGKRYLRAMYRGNLQAIFEMRHKS